MSDIFGKISIEAEKPQKPAEPKKKQKKNPPPTLPPSKRQVKRNRLTTTKLMMFMIPIGLLSLYAIIGYWGVPYYLKTYIPEVGGQEYNVDISPGNITFNPFSFTLKTESTKVDDQQGESIAYLPHLELNFAPIQLLRMDFVCTKVVLTSPSLNLVRNDNGSYNFSSILLNIKESSDTTGMIGFSDLPFSFSLNNISITAGELTFADKPNKKTHIINNIELQLPTLANIDFKASDYIAPHFSAIFNGSPISFKAETSKNEITNSLAQPQLAWEMKDFPLQDYVRYLPFELPFSINKGTAEGIVGLRFNNLNEKNKKEEKLSISFKLIIGDIDFETHQKKLQLRSPSMNITGSFAPVKKLFLIEDLQFKSPEFTAHTPDLFQELSNIFLIKEKKDQLGIVDKPVVLSLQSLQFKNGKLSHKKTLNKNETPLDWVKLDAQISNYVSHQSNSPSNKKVSIVNLTGQKKNTTNVFSYTGSFESPSTLSGRLSVDNITSQNLFSFMLPDEKSTTFKGSAKLNSVFTLALANDTETFSPTFSQTNVTIDNMKIFEKKKSIFEAKELSLSDALLTGNIVNLGEVKIKNGALSYSLQKNSSIFSKIVTGKYLISSLDYVGDINILPINKTGSPFRLEKSSIKYSGNSSSKKKADNITISGSTGTSGKFEGAGTASLSPFKMMLSTKFDSIDNATLTSILPQNNFISQSTGKISGKGRITFPQTSFTGDLSLANGTYHANKKPSLSWSEFDLENINFTTQPYHLDVGSITLIKPVLISSIEPQKGSMDQQLTGFLRNTLKKNKKNTTNQQKIALSSLDIQKITITNGNLTVSDHRLSPPWTGKLDNVSGSIENIHSANSASNSPFTFTGNIDGSEFTWKGTVDPLKNTQTDKYQFTVTNYPLNNFAQQLQPLSDINFNSATISMTNSSDWVNGDLSHSVRSQLSQLKIDTPNSETALPLAILADVNGNTKIDASTLQIASQKNSNLFDNLTGNLQKLILKGNLSPLLLATGDFSDLMDIEFIDFKPGLFMLSNTGRKTLLRYGAFLVAHPNIKLRLSGGLYRNLDKDSLHRQLEKNEKLRVENENEKLFAKWQQKKQEYESQLKNNQDQATSTGAIAESDIPTKVLAGFRPLLPEPVVVDNEMLLELAEKRLDIVKQHFMTQLALTKGRVDITQQSINTVSKNNNGMGVHVEIMPFESSLLFQD